MAKVRVHCAVAAVAARDARELAFSTLSRSKTRAPAATASARKVASVPCLFACRSPRHDHPAAIDDGSRRFWPVALYG